MGPSIFTGDFFSERNEPIVKISVSRFADRKSFIIHMILKCNGSEIGQSRTESSPIHAAVLASVTQLSS